MGCGALPLLLGTASAALACALRSHTSAASNHRRLWSCLLGRSPLIAGLAACLLDGCMCLDPAVLTAFFPPFFLHIRRIFTFTYVALLFGIMGYNVELSGLDGFNSINNMLFTTVLIMLLMPYVGISLYTADKTMYIADAGARRYRASAYYVAKVGGFGALGFRGFQEVLGFAFARGARLCASGRDSTQERTDLGKQPSLQHRGLVLLTMLCCGVL